MPIPDALNRGLESRVTSHKRDCTAITMQIPGWVGQGRKNRVASRKLCDFSYGGLLYILLYRSSFLLFLIYSHNEVLAVT